MYAETELMYPYFQSYSQEVESFEDFCGFQKDGGGAASMENMLASTMVGYDLGEGDLFKAPEPIVEEQVMSLDPMSGTVSVISAGSGIISPQSVKVVDMGSIQSQQLLSEVFYECKKDLLAKSGMQDPIIGDLDIKVPPAAQMEKDSIAELDGFLSTGAVQKCFSPRRLEDPIEEIDRLIWEGSQGRTVNSRCFEDPIEEMDRLIWEGSHQKCVSSRCLEDPIEGKDGSVLEDMKPKSVSTGCLSSMEWTQNNVTRPNFSDFQGVDFGATYGMRRAFSESDIQALNSRNTNLMHSPFERSSTIGSYTMEERMESLSRYRKKKAKRNFGRTIKYACRKALADNQPRVRGRFARTEESNISRK